MGIIQKLFPSAFEGFLKISKKKVVGSISFGCNAASISMIGLYFDNIDNDLSLIVWGIVMALAAGAYVGLNQMGLAKKCFADYCNWNRISHYMFMILPLLLMLTWGLLIVIPKFLQNYCMMKYKKYGQ